VTVTLQLKPNMETRLIAQAQASGMALEEYLLSLVEGAALPELSEAKASPARHEAIRRMLEFGERNRLSLSEPVTRKLLHEGHRL
jgi:hypothetical protein